MTQLNTHFYSSVCKNKNYNRNWPHFQTSQNYLFVILSFIPNFDNETSHNLYYFDSNLLLDTAAKQF